MIRSWRHKGLRELFETGRSRRVAADLQARVLRRLDRLNVAAQPGEMNVPGFDYHPLRGRPQRYTVHVNGPWCITFGWDEMDATELISNSTTEGNLYGEGADHGSYSDPPRRAVA